MEASPWWMINLGGQNYIDSITIWGVDGANAERLSNFYVLMSTAPFVTTVLQAGAGVLWWGGGCEV